MTDLNHTMGNKTLSAPRVTIQAADLAFEHGDLRGGDLKQYLKWSCTPKDVKLAMLVAARKTLGYQDVHSAHEVFVQFHSFPFRARVISADSVGFGEVAPPSERVFAVLWKHALVDVLDEMHNRRPYTVRYDPPTNWWVASFVVNPLDASGKCAEGQGQPENPTRGRRWWRLPRMQGCIYAPGSHMPMVERPADQVMSEKPPEMETSDLTWDALVAKRIAALAPGEYDVEDFVPKRQHPWQWVHRLHKDVNGTVTVDKDNQGGLVMLLE